MLRPEGGWCAAAWRGVFVAAALAITLAAPLAAARADTAKRATANLSPALSPPAVQPLPDSLAPPDSVGASGPSELSGARRLAGRIGETYGPEQRAQELYLDGLDKLDAGHPDWAERTFEDLIARYPDSPAAGLARGRLGELYRGKGDSEHDARRGDVVKAAATPAVIETPAIRFGPAWEQELRRNASIQEKLRMDVGDRVFFAAGSAELGSRAREALSAQAQWLKRWHEFEAAIEGHADEPGSDDENLKLSELRAEAVRQRLVEEGVEPSRLAVVPWGRTQRIATCQELGCGSQNRRAVTLVFASGTSERLGLSGLVSAAPLDRGDTLVGAAQTVPPPGAAERVGAAR